MGYKALSWAMGLDLPDTKCFAVLVAMANYADEKGVCWPSQTLIANKTKLARETVNRTIKNLIKLGLISREKDAYILKMGVTEDHKYVTEDHTQEIVRCDSGSQMCDLGSQGCDSGSHPSKPVNNQSINSQKKNTPRPPKKKRRKKTEHVSEKPDDVSAQVWTDFQILRKQKKAPITETVLSRIRSEAEKAGWSMDAALSESCVRSWQGFNADWVKGRKCPQAQEKATNAPTGNEWLDIIKTEELC